MRATASATLSLILCACAGSACAGSPAPSPAAREAEVARPAARTAPDHEAAREAPLAEDPVPDGEACEASDACGEGQMCRGPVGCESDWGCGAPRACGHETVSFCGCDGMTFYAQENCPGRPYQSVGPCDALGEVDDEPTEEVEGNRICTADSDCRSGWVCAGVEGCATFWTCVPRGRVRPRCTRDRVRFCSCEGDSFEASGTCPGRPFVHRGYCPGDEPAVVAVAPSEAAPAPAPAHPPALTPTPTPTPTPHPTPPPRAGDAGVGRTLGSPTSSTCGSNRDCSGGEICQGAEGCGGPWHCARPTRACVGDTQYFCGCDGESFRASMTCPGRPHRHRGSCPPGD